MRGIGARSACFRRPQLIHQKTRRDIPDSMSTSRSSNIVPWHFSQRYIDESPVVLPVRLKKSSESTGERAYRCLAEKMNEDQKMNKALSTDSSDALTRNVNKKPHGAE